MKRVTRRVAWAALAPALLMAWTGCTGSSEPPRAINLLAWSEYIPRPIIEGFTAETGIRVNYETFASNEEMLAKLVSGAQKYDVIQPSDYTVQALIRAERLQLVNWERVPNIRNIGSEFRNLPHDPYQRYSVPWMAGSVGIVVNTARVTEPIKGYNDVFQDKYKGRIVVVNDPREIVSWALATLGKGPNDVTPQTLEQVRPILARWLPLVKVYDSDSPKTALLGGDVDLGIVWSGEAAALWNEDKKFQYMLPSEGAHRFLDTLALPIDAPDPLAAMDFLNYVLRPEVSKLISDDFPYTNPNLEARKLLTPAQLANPASYPPGDPQLEGFLDIGDAAVAIDKLVTDLKAKN